MKKRVFVGVKICQDLVKKIELWKKNFLNLPVRWIASDNLHLTLLPPWYTQDIHSLINHFQSFQTSVKPFVISFEKITFGPNPNLPHLIWVSGQTPPALSILKRDLEFFLKQPSEKRDFLLHLTLARFKKEKFSCFPFKILDEKINWQQQVSSVNLYQSFLSKDGANYQVLAKVSL